MQCMGRAAHRRSCRRRGREGSRWACTGSSTTLAKGTSRYRQQQFCAARWGMIYFHHQVLFTMIGGTQRRQAALRARRIGIANSSQGVQRFRMPACMSCCSPTLCGATAQERMGAGRAQGATQLSIATGAAAVCAILGAE
jgi:hypothetical protein